MIQTLKLTAKNAVEALKNAGAEKAQSIVTYTVTHEFNVDGGEFSLFRTLFDKSLKMSAITGGKRGTVAQNRYDDATIRESAKACLEAAEASMPAPWRTFAITASRWAIIATSSECSERLSVRAFLIRAQRSM